MLLYHCDLHTPFSQSTAPARYAAAVLHHCDMFATEMRLCTTIRCLVTSGMLTLLASKSEPTGYIKLLSKAQEVKKSLCFFWHLFRLSPLLSFSELLLACLSWLGRLGGTPLLSLKLGVSISTSISLQCFLPRSTLVLYNYLEPITTVWLLHFHEHSEFSRVAFYGWVSALCDDVMLVSSLKLKLYTHSKRNLQWFQERCCSTVSQMCMYEE